MPSRAKKAIGRIILLALASAFAQPASADSICFDTLGWGAPPVPGDPNDQHWSSVFRFDFNNGTPQHDATLMAGSSGTTLYLQWMVRNADSFNNTDRVTVAFQDSAGAYWMIVVQPNCTGIGRPKNCSGGAPVCDPAQPACAGNDRPLQTIFYAGTFNPTAAPGQRWTWHERPVPAGMVFGSGSTGTGQANAVNTWWVQLKMPQSIAGSYTINGTPNSWRLYTNAFRIDSAQAQVTELTWPNNAGNLVFLDPLRGIPDPSSWGLATIGNGGCTGIHLTSIRTDTVLNGTPAPTTIDFNATSQHLLADYTNTGPLEARCVSARFRIANFGIADDWADVPAAGNPTAPPITIASGAAGTFSTGPWNVTTDPHRASYDPAHANDADPSTRSHPHQCIRVDLGVDPSSGCTPTSAGTTFDVASMYQNMDFGQASVFTGTPAEIRGDLANVPKDRPKNVYDLKPIASAIARENTARLTYAVHASVRTGKTISLPTGRMIFVEPNVVTGPVPELITYEVVDRLPSFGYVVDHKMTQAEAAKYAKLPSAQQVDWWKYEMTGLPKNPKAPGRYVLEVNRDQTVVAAAPRIEFAGDPGNGPACKDGTCFCKCGQVRKGPPALIITTLLMGMVGLFTLRRRS